jgi:predicted  nucleic acid-binding Zn-ribbon protein
MFMQRKAEIQSSTNAKCLVSTIVSKFPISDVHHAAEDALAKARQDRQEALRDVHAAQALTTDRERALQAASVRMESAEEAIKAARLKVRPFREKRHADIASALGPVVSENKDRMAALILELEAYASLADEANDAIVKAGGQARPRYLMAVNDMKRLLG